MNHRPLRVANLIREELGKLIAKELEFENALSTITDVQVNNKLTVANVGVSVWPNEKAEEVLTQLNRAQRKLQGLLLRKMNIKPMPQIRFLIDHGPTHAANVEKVLKDQ